MIKGAWLTTNRSCNNSCEWCYAKKAKGGDMDVDNAKECIDALCEIGIKNITLIGGEPTIYPHFFELVDYIKQKGLSVSLATNGRKFRDIDFVNKIIKSKIDGINISIKALSEEEYYEKTKNYGLEDVVIGYANLIHEGYRPILSYVVIEYDEKQIVRLISLLEDNKMDNIIFQFVKPVIDFQSEDIMDLRDMGKMVRIIYNKMKVTNIKYKIEISFPICLVDENILENLINENKIMTCCHVQAGRGIVFDTDFKVLPCNHFANFPFLEKSVGLTAKEILSLFNSEGVKNFRERTQCYPSNKCIECDNWDICGGGCFSRWLYVDPNDYI